MSLLQASQVALTMARMETLSKLSNWQTNAQVLISCVLQQLPSLQLLQLSLQPSLLRAIAISKFAEKLLNQGRKLDLLVLISALIANVITAGLLVAEALYKVALMELLLSISMLTNQIQLQKEARIQM